ncbi:hypothetical protein HO173_013070 [Letharia columbiana]|uniref:Ferric oxidoreductase domain-containing protein n=1 Tax=Letharia columbiana TaxID=112416 RepID=A0A8H6CI44_9LECA|nr:uncharacterized protein HO173_013070 [Letharia columbiana]KAF6223907.1 hypothetical protein HO173_013070 [Letharia columbiana]
MHALIFLAAQDMEPLQYNLYAHLQRFGIIAAILMPIVAITPLSIRRRNYETWYMVRIIAAVSILTKAYRYWLTLHAHA